MYSQQHVRTERFVHNTVFGMHVRFTSLRQQEHLYTSWRVVCREETYTSLRCIVDLYVSTVYRETNTVVRWYTCFRSRYEIREISHVYAYIRKYRYIYIYVLSDVFSGGGVYGVPHLSEIFFLRLQFYNPKLLKYD